MTYLLIAWNALVFLMYGLDKIKAKNKLVRIPEAMLLIFGFLFGGMGALFGMVAFNHKTSKMKFRLLVPVAAVLNMLVFCADYAVIFTEIYDKIS